MRKFSIEDKLTKSLNKISKKDKALFEAIWGKILEIASSDGIDHYKNLRAPMQAFKRVHIKSSFVLTFKYIKSEDRIVFYGFKHHDKIYK